MTRVLVVDDEPQILRALRINLHARQYDVVTAGTGRGALEAAADAHPDLVILDLGLPDMDGVDVIRSLRKWTQVPIVILSGRINSAAKVDALDAGADDYVTKPFSVEELLARIRAVTRRTTEPELIPPIELGRWTVDLSDHLIYETLPANVDANNSQLEGTRIKTPVPQVHLTPTEWQLLQALVRHPGRLVSQRQLLQEVWGPTYVDQTHYLRQYVKALRQKLEDDPTRPRHLITEPGMGYRFQP
jgi:two-component system KDP operon response regulator KdpE